MARERYESKTFQNRLANFYTNDIIFTICVVVILALSAYTLYQNIYNILLDPSSGPYESAGTKVIIIISVIVLFIGYLKDNKNAMQSMMGALLSLLVIKSVPLFIEFVVRNLFETSFWYSVYIVVVTVAFLLLFINHQLINRLYISSPGRVFFNEVVVVVLTVSYVALFAYYLASGWSFWEAATTFASLGNYVLIADCVVFVEANIDYERLQREGE